MDILNWFYTVRSYVQTYAHSIKARWLFSLIWALALAAVIWFYGDTIALGNWRPLGSVERRLAVIGVIVAAWVVYVLWLAVAQRRANAAIIAELGDDGDDARQGRGDGRAELAELRGRLSDALTTMRKVVGGGRGYVYKLPWYLIIGSPGSGKTTALANCGLKFPLGEEFGPDPIAGVAGTRNCDWWFAEDAILIDTAGRYTTPDSGSDADRTAWLGFLGLLKRHRRLQPINGVLLVIGVDELADTATTDRLNLARTFRRRLRELEEAFGLRIPIYVVVTKVDRIAGFVPFFDGFSRSDREQPWGVTFSLTSAQTPSLDVARAFAGEFDLLIRRLDDLLLERLQHEMDIERRSLAFGFPAQISLLKDPIQEVLSEISSASKFDKPPLVRGVYLASSTQTGGQIDRLMQSMAASFGLPAPRQPIFAGVTKTYFLTRLLKSVVFGEAGLVSSDFRARQRTRRVAQVAAAGAAVGILGLGVAWGATYFHTVRQITDVSDRLADFKKLSSTIPVQDVADNDMRRVAEALDTLRSAAASLGPPDLSGVDLGLGQSDKLLSGHKAAYRRALNALLLPRILVRLQERIREPGIDPNLAFESLKLYLMLGAQGPLDREFVQTYLRADWEALYPGESRALLRRSLDQHLSALLSDSFEPIPLDENIVDTARKGVSGLTATDRAFAFMQQRASALKLPMWRPIDRMGAGGRQLFVRMSGKDLSDGIPGLYTREGYFSVVLPSLREIDRKIADEDWVRGDATQRVAASGDIVGETLRLYRSEFDKNWRELLSDIRLVPLTSLAQVADVLNGLAGADSSMKRLLIAVATDTNLQAPSEKTESEEATRIRTLIAAAGKSPNTTTPPDPFGPLRDYVTAGRDGAGRVDDLTRTIDELYRQVTRAVNGTSDTNGLLRVDGGINDVNQKLLADARRFPTPVDAWMAALATDVSTIVTGKSRTQVGQLWTATSRRLCEIAVNNHYPFNRNSPSDISIEDFSRLFGPNGQLDRFFRDNLQSVVDTSSRPWRWRSGYGKVGATSESLEAFERAATIREAFFATGGASPVLNFDVTPVALDALSTVVLLGNGDQEVIYNHGPVRPYVITWPSNLGARQARLSFQPSNVGSTMTRTGPWALFRLIDAGARKATQDRILVTFATGDHSATFDIRTGSALNPLTLPALREFRCPKEL
jgi:type VI secretion system protein ImpL